MVSIEKSKDETGTLFWVDFEKGPSLNEFLEVFLAFEKEDLGGYESFVLQFSEKVTVQKNRGGQTVTDDEIRLRLFYNRKKQFGYTFHRIKGMYASNLPIEKLVRISVFNPSNETSRQNFLEKEKKKKKEIRNLLKSKFDDETWSSLKEEDVLCHGTSKFYLKRIFSERQMEQIKEVFETKEKERWVKGGAESEYVLRTTYEDSEFRAILHTENYRTGKQRSYVVLNPVWATFGV